MDHRIPSLLAAVVTVLVSSCAEPRAAGLLAGSAGLLPEAATVGELAAPSRDGLGTVTIGFGGTANARYQTMARRWVASDLVAFELALSAQGRSLATAAVMLKQGQDRITLSHLRPGIEYQVQVVALGNVGGIPADPVQVLNTMTPATGSIAFGLGHPMEASRTVTIQVQLDSVPPEPAVAP